MTREEFLSALDALIAEKHLLKHPFYQLWSQGRLTTENLREYAVSYYPHIAAFPTYVSGVHAGCEDASLRQELLENLIEEERGTENHPALWRRFAGALGASESDMASAPRTPEVAEAIAEFRRTTRDGSTAEGLAALYAYESADPGSLEDQARGPRGLLRHRRRGRDAVLLGPREGRRVAPAGGARGARPRGRDAGSPREGPRGGPALLRCAQPRARRRDAGERARLLTR